MTIVPAEFVEFPHEETVKMCGVTTPEWPVAFTRLLVDADRFIENYPCNHIHGVYGDCTESLITAAYLLDMDYEVYK